MAITPPAVSLGPVRPVVEMQLRQPELERVVTRVALAEEDQRPEEVVPCALELEDGERGHRRQRERQHDAPERLEVPGAVELRRLLEVLGIVRKYWRMKNRFTAETRLIRM